MDIEEFYCNSSTSSFKTGSHCMTHHNSNELTKNFSPKTISQNRFTIEQVTIGTHKSINIKNISQVTDSFEDDSSEPSTRVSNSCRVQEPKQKTTKLSLFSKNFNDLVSDFKKRRTPKPPQTQAKSFSFTTAWKNYTKINPQKVDVDSNYFDFDDASYYTNTERISDFYEYTDNCMKQIKELPQKKDNSLRKVSLPKSNNKKLALFDLDETLVHCTGNITNNQEYQYIVQVTLPLGKKVKIGINVRPHMKQALDMLKQYYTLVIFTASHQSYTDAVMELIDPNREYFEYRLYRNNCLPTKIDGKDFFIKDLSIIENYSLNEMVIIDNSVLSFAYHIDNGIPIVPYYEGEEDSELPILAYYLSTIYNDKDLREANRKYMKLDTYLSPSESKIEDSSTSSSQDTDNPLPDIITVKKTDKFYPQYKEYMSILKQNYLKNKKL